MNFVANRCDILKLKCTKFDFGWGSAETPLGELTAQCSLEPWIKGAPPLGKGMERGRKRREMSRR